MLHALYRSAVRHLLKNKTPALLNIFGIAIGVATCLLIMVWAERELSFDTFHPNVVRKFRVWNTFKSESESFSQAPSGVALGARLPENIPSVVSACRVFGNRFKFTYEDKTFFEANAIIADSSFFTFFGFPLLKGDASQLLRNPDELVMTEAAAIKYFGSADAAIDKVVSVDGEPMKVAGVAVNVPTNSHIQFDVVIPYKRLHAYALKSWKQDLDNQWVGGWPYTYIEIAETANRDAVEASVNEVVARFSKKEWDDNKMSYQYFLQPITDIHLKSSLRYDSDNGSLSTLRIFTAVAIFILLLACINYINLTTATALRRAKEISLRKVVGASREQLMRQLFIETFTVSTISVALAFVLLELALPAFSTWMGQPYAFPFNLRSVGTVALFVACITLLSGFYPAVVLSGFRPIEAMRGRFSHSHTGQLARRFLVVLQFTISTVLLISLFTVHNQMTFIQEKSLG
jgi:putative ABC transport system permease protein